MIFLINGAAVKSPAKMQIDIRPIGRVETAASGDTVTDVIAYKRKISAEWKYTERAEAGAIMRLVTGSAFFALTYHDYIDDVQATRDFRISQCTITPYRYRDGIPQETTLKITFEER